MGAGGLQFPPADARPGQRAHRHDVNARLLVLCHYRNFGRFQHQLQGAFRLCGRGNRAEQKQPRGALLHADLPEVGEQVAGAAFYGHTQAD